MSNVLYTQCIVYTDVMSYINSKRLGMDGGGLCYLHSGVVVPGKVGQERHCNENRK